MGGYIFLPIAIPLYLTAVYSASRAVFDTFYKTYEDLAFMARKHGDNIKIFQDVARLDLTRKITSLEDKMDKASFLQLQALVGLSRFNPKDKNGERITFETDSHDVVKRVIQKLESKGYLQNYEEKELKKSRLILPKLAFGNTDLKEKIQIYNMKFQLSDKEIDFESPEIRKMFPGVFGKRGIIAKEGYKIERDEEGTPYINYGKRKKKIETTENRGEQRKDKGLKERINSGISQEEQLKYVIGVIEKNGEQTNNIRDKEQEK